SPLGSEEREFVLSTPRLPDEGSLGLDLPFSHEAIDNFFKLKEAAKPFEAIDELLGTSREQEPLLRSFLTEKGPERHPAYEGDAIRIRYFGHACILIETKDVTIMTDPLISYDY